MKFTMTPNRSIREAYVEASSFLEQHASAQNPPAVSEWLITALMNWDRSQLYLRWYAPFPQEKRAQWERWITRRAEGEPVQYILGEQEFYGLSFHVNPSVLIPRPETELLVEAVLEHGERIRGTVADIGTGSGAIAVTLAKQQPNWQLFAVDISDAALATARRNAERHQVDQRVQFMQGDLLEPFISARQSIDIVVSNPPYIPSAEIPALQVEVQRFEPMLALDGGADGLDLYKRLITQMQHLPQWPQLVALEVGQGQARQVAALLEACQQWPHTRIISDLSGIERHVVFYS